MKDGLLEVGDVIFDTDRWQGIQRYVIDRVSAKQAFSGVNKFQREVVKNKDFFSKKETLVVKKIGEYGSADLATPKWEENYELQNLKRTAERVLQSVNASLLNKEQLNAVINLLSPLRDLSKK